MASKWLSMDMWKNWERQGKADFLKHCRQLLDGSDVSPLLSSASKSKALTRAIYELIWHGIKGPLRREVTVNAIGDLVELHRDMPSVILDVISIVDTETSCNESRTDDRERFCSIVKDAEKFLSDPLLKERLEIDFLQDVAILKNKKAFHTKLIKVKTKLFYKQQKFNLFREESEGYAKLATELNQEPDPTLGPKHILEVIKSLIGCFNLDPNRVLDVVLESFECHPERHNFFVQLLQAYMPDPHTLCEVLGFKFGFYRDAPPGGDYTPGSLYTTTALLIQHEVIGLDDIYGWLVPDDKLIQRCAEKELREAREFARRMNIVSTKEKEKPDATEEKENPMEKYQQNQKLGLCEALLRVGDWKHCQELMKRLPDFFAVAHPPIARALCHLIHAVIEPVYRKHSGLSPKIKGHVVTPPSSPLAPPAADTFTSLQKDAFPMLLALGPHLHQDAVLVYKVLRLARAVLSQKGSTGSDMYYTILTVMEEVILPSLSLMDANCCVAEEVWGVLRMYPYQHRYHLYGLWKNDSWQNHPALMKKKADALKHIKSIMKRVSKENVKPIGRLIGKLTHSAPGILFDYILSQVQIYDNLIVPVVDSLKYLTSLSYDVLAFCVVEALAHPDKERTKHDGTTISIWLQSLSAFCGAVFKKYNIELTGLLQYVANQLKAKKSLDLLILKEIIQKMAGIEAAEEMTSDQLEAMAGGELLKAEAGYFSQVRNTKKSSQRLKEALAESDLALALCLLMAQQRNCVVYQETENSHLKLVGKLYDQCQDALVQFGTFLATNWSMDDYARRVPPVNELLSDYFIHADVAFFLARPMFAHAINSKFDELRRADKGHKGMTSAQKQHKYVDACEQVMGPVVESIRPLHPPKIWDDISPQFYVTFWALTMYDLGAPSESYGKEVARIKHQGMQVSDNKDLVASKRKKEQERCQALMEKLQEEEKKQREHVERVMARLRQEKNNWFLSRSAKSAKNETVTQFLQLCLFPRCIFTATDAVYCAKFVHTVHSLKTPNFSTLICYDRIFCDITYTVTSCTENEANRYGRFLCAMLETVMRWHSDKTIFEKECANYPGFVTKFRVSNQASEANDHVDYENYRHVCHKWHYKIAKALVVCLESKDYVQIRNSIVILIKILPHFPVISNLGQVLEKRIDKVCKEEKDKRQDLYVLATSYNGQLKTKKPAMISEDKFHQVTRKTAAKQMDSTTVKSEPSSTGGTSASAMNHGNGKESDKNLDKSDSKEKERKPGSTGGVSGAGRSGEGNIGNRSSGASKLSTSNNSMEGTKPREIISLKDKSEKDKAMTKEVDGEIRLKKEEGSAEKRFKEKREERQRLKEEKMLRAEERLQKQEERREEREREREASEGSTGSGGSDHRRRSQEPPDFDRDIKRRKLEQAGSSKSEESKRRDLEVEAEKAERKEKRAKSKEKLREEKKEKKMERKRERLVESPSNLELKRKREEERMALPRHQGHANGEPLEHREKHHYPRDKSPNSQHYREKERQRERERSHDRADLREKHRRSAEGKRR